MELKYNVCHIGFRVKDMQKSLEYYVDKLGMELMFPLYHEDGSLWLNYVRAGQGQFLELFPVGPDEEVGQPRDEQSFFHFALQVEDIAATIAELQRRGVGTYYLHSDAIEGRPIVGEYKPTFVPACGSLVAFLMDPDGNLIELQQYTERSLQIKHDHP